MGRFTGGSAFIDLPDLDIQHPLGMESRVIKMMGHCLVFGRGDLVSLFTAVSSLAPAYRNSRVEHVDIDDEHQWVARLPNSGAAWTAIEGTEGSAIYTAFPPTQAMAEQMIREADLPIERGIRRPWGHADVKSRQPYPAEFVQIFCSASRRSAWEIPALAHLRPSSLTSSSAAVASGPAAGWYPDPDPGGGRYRWWDGSRWTEHVQG